MSYVLRSSFLSRESLGHARLGLAYPCAKMEAHGHACAFAIYPLLLGAVYLGGMIWAAMGHGAEGGGFSSIDGVRTLFSSDIGMIIGWTHYLVFDLFVGAWEARDAQRRGFSHWLLTPCLLLTFMLGPVGLLLYLVLRKVTNKGG